MRDFFQKMRPNKRFHVAFSGGMDSHVLLFACHRLQSEWSLDLSAIHINHQLSPNANRWSDACKSTCEQLNIPFVSYDIQLDLTLGESLEAMAREKRYDKLKATLHEDEILLTAHHQEDQAETLLLQLFRGAGLKGLSAMPSVRSFGRGSHARPLLGVSKNEIKAFAIEHQFKWLEDESNSNEKLTRNFLRHTIMPQLVSRWPTISKTLSRSATHLAEAQTLLESYSAGLLNQTLGQSGDTLLVSQLLELPPPKRRLALRTWIEQRGFSLPSTKKLDAICSDVLEASWDSAPCVAWDRVELRRFRDELYMMPALNTHEPHKTIDWDLTQPLNVPGVGCLTANLKPGTGLRLKGERVRVGFRQGGEMLDLPGRGRHTLKNLFQEWGVPVWLRDRTPLVYLGEKILVVAGYYIDPLMRVTKDEEGYEITITTEPMVGSVT